MIDVFDNCLKRDQYLVHAAKKTQKRELSLVIDK